MRIDLSSEPADYNLLGRTLFNELGKLARSNGGQLPHAKVSGVVAQALAVARNVHSPVALSEGLSAPTIHDTDTFDPAQYWAANGFTEDHR